MPFPFKEYFFDRIDNMEAMKELFSFSKAKSSMGFGASEEDGTFMSVGIGAK